MLSTPVWTDSAAVGNLRRILAIYSPQICPLRMEKNVEVEGPASILSAHERTRFNLKSMTVLCDFFYYALRCRRISDLMLLFRINIYIIIDFMTIIDCGNMLNHMLHHTTKLTNLGNHALSLQQVWRENCKYEPYSLPRMSKEYEKKCFHNIKHVFDLLLIISSSEIHEYCPKLTRPRTISSWLLMSSYIYLLLLVWY